MVVVPVGQTQNQAPINNTPNPPDTNPSPHIPNPPPLTNLPAHIPILPPSPLLPGHIPNPPAQVSNPEQSQNPQPQVPNPNQRIKAEEKFPISGQGYRHGRLLDNTECSILIDTGASKSYMSKSHYMQCKSLHTLPMFASTIQRVQIGNGQCEAVLFVIPVIVDIHGHKCEVFMLVSEIHDNVDLVLGINNVFELEGVIDTWDSSFKFLNRSLPVKVKVCKE